MHVFVEGGMDRVWCEQRGPAVCILLCCNEGPHLPALFWWGYHHVGCWAEPARDPSRSCMSV
jgi:hypothetical protein